MCLYSILAVLLIKASAALKTCLMYKLLMKFVTDGSSFLRQKCCCKHQCFHEATTTWTPSSLFQNPNILLFCCLFVCFLVFQNISLFLQVQRCFQKTDVVKVSPELKIHFLFETSKQNYRLHLLIVLQLFTGKQNQGLCMRESYDTELAIHFPSPEFPHGGCLWPSQTKCPSSPPGETRHVQRKSKTQRTLRDL